MQECHQTEWQILAWHPVKINAVAMECYRVRKRSTRTLLPTTSRLVGL